MSKSKKRSKPGEFFTLPEEERLETYELLYYESKNSWAEIAKLLGTYPNKARRDAAKLGMSSRDKSKAQQLAISEGRCEHPTEGKQQSEKTRIKISESQGKVWDDLSEEDREYRSEIGKKSWDDKTDLEKENFFKKSVDAIQKASKEGSKVELELFNYLIEEGYKVLKHKEHFLKNEKFHLDLYLPEQRIAIEVDGPMHFKPVYGEEKLNKRQAADSSKNGLVLSGGMVLIRVKLDKRQSQRYIRSLKAKLLGLIKEIGIKFPIENERYFEI